MTRHCPACAQSASLYFTTTDINQRVSDSLFDYYRCPSCKLVFLSPIPDDLGSYYVSNYPAYQLPSLQELSEKAESERYKLDIIKKYATRGRLLEIGPAYGGFSYLAKIAGFDVEAIEMDANCSRFLNNVVGIHTIHSLRLEDALNELTPFNVIVLWHVLEHLPDPWKAMSAIVDKLQPGGVVVLTTPNPFSLQFKIFGRFWVHVDAPRHVNLLPPVALQRYVESIGLHTERITTTDEAGVIFHALGWWGASFRNIINDSIRRSRPDKLAGGHRNVSRSLFSRVAEYLMHGARFPAVLISLIFALGTCFILFLILKPFERMEGLGSAYTMVIRK